MEAEILETSVKDFLKIFARSITKRAEEEEYNNGEDYGNNS